MPPKKKVSVTPSLAEHRSTRASARRKDQGSLLTPPSPPSTSTAVKGSKKRAAAAMDIDKVDMTDELDKSGVKNPTSKKKKTAAPRRASAEKWFYLYADEKTGKIDPQSAQKWMTDLGIHPDGVFFYCIMYKCKVSTPMAISKEEFVKYMNSLKIKSNEQLLERLPRLLDAIRPRAEPEPNPAFKPFYKWCFEHFRPENAKNIDVEIAAELFKVLLDEDKYNIGWKPSEAVSPGNPTPGSYPHVDAFVEFITTEPRPVAVITRDQFDQFYHFNLSVSWSLKEHSEESAWPALLDRYANWKDKKYPVPKTSVVQAIDGGEEP